ncbi:hypothetical protein [Bdellovibrio sp. HCB209]|uniref:hypothetical protein n=1 Tax=Bdellovibrio sp. HCB209 TaxID=3394354 RepID=UPI0039B5208A
MKKYALPVFVIVIATLLYVYKPQKMTENSLPEGDSVQETANTPTTEQVNSVASPTVVMEKNKANPGRQELVDLIKMSRQAQNRPEMEEQVSAMRERLNQLPNKSDVLWAYYEEIKSSGTPMERAEVLDLFSSSDSDSKLADVALTEASAISTEPIMDLDSARTQEEMNEALSTKEEWVPTLVSFEVFIKNCGNYNSCRPGIDSVMHRNRNRNLRANLIEIISQKFPDEAHRMDP